jgi:hypothetical protein
VSAAFDFSGRPGPWGAIRAFRDTLRAARNHDVLWLISQHPARIAGAGLGRLTYGTPFVVDTGDLLFESARTTGKRGLKTELIRRYEPLSLRLPDAVVVRGSKHLPIARRMGARRAELLRDGVEVEAFTKADGAAVRRRLAGTATVVGVVSTIGWEPHLRLPSPGWDVVEVLSRLPDLDLVGLIVGDGPGLAALRRLAEDRAVAGRMRWVPRVPLAELPSYLAAIDIFLHTALNNPMSQVRSTGKLPLLLASGRAAVVSRVGEAALVLEETGMLLDFEGSPEDYAARLAARVRLMLERKELGRWREAGPRAARTYFAYEVLAGQAERLIRDLAATRCARRREL